MTGVPAIVLRGKASREDGMPLRADVGEALSAYLRQARAATGEPPVVSAAVPLGAVVVSNPTSNSPVVADGGAHLSKESAGATRRPGSGRFGHGNGSPAASDTVESNYPWPAPASPATVITLISAPLSLIPSFGSQDKPGLVATALTIEPSCALFPVPDSLGSEHFEHFRVGNCYVTPISFTAHELTQIRIIERRLHSQPDSISCQCHSVS